MPIVGLLLTHWLLAILAAPVFAGNNAAGSMTTGGSIRAYTTDPDAPVGFERTRVLIAVSFTAVTWFIFTLLSGYLSDKIGCKRTCQVGFVALILVLIPLCWMANTALLGLLYLALALFSTGLALTYAPRAALYSALFHASVRFSGVAISHALGAIIGDAFAPMIAMALVQTTGGPTAVSVCLVARALIGLVAVTVLRDRSGIDLSIKNQAEQEVGATIFDQRAPATDPMVSQPDWSFRLRSLAPHPTHDHLQGRVRCRDPLPEERAIPAAREQSSGKKPAIRCAHSCARENRMIGLRGRSCVM